MRRTGILAPVVDITSYREAWAARRLVSDCLLLVQIDWTLRLLDGHLDDATARADMVEIEDCVASMTELGITHVADVTQGRVAAWAIPEDGPVDHVRAQKRLTAMRRFFETLSELGTWGWPRSQGVTPSALYDDPMATECPGPHPAGSRST